MLLSGAASCARSPWLGGVGWSSLMSELQINDSALQFHREADFPVLIPDESLPY